MAANTAIPVTGLNYNEIRANLRDFIAAKPDFADFDFQDSALGTLLDLLAYNTYYNAFYASMAASEAFIDSAQFYDSVVSRAKLVNYTPVSAQGATANVRISFVDASVSSSLLSINIPKNTEFTSTINSISYTFVTPRAYTVLANSSNGFATNIDLVEGIPLTHRYLFTSSNTEFILPNSDVDTRSISVTVTSSGNTSTYTPVSDILTINSSSKIFYIEADRDSKYKISFGDDVLGDKPDFNSTVAISYRVCNGTRGNGANNFTSAGSIDNQSVFTLSVNNRAVGGSSQEDIESVRFNAPKNYETQNRAVIAADYQRIILRDNRDLQAVNVWGGEENDPPIYGKVYASVKPIIGTLISASRAAQIKTNIRKYNVQSIDLEIVDPTFVFIEPTITVNMNVEATTLSASEIAALVAARVIAYEGTNLNRFGGRFRYSKFLNYLDNSDIGITGSSGSVQLQKRFIPSTTVKNSYTFNFNQRIANHMGGTNSAVSSSRFTLNGEDNSFIDDDAEGNIRTYYTSGINKIYTNVAAGTVNYDTGKIVLNAFIPTAYVGNHISINVIPTTQNFAPIRNQILLISGASIKVFDDETQKELAAITSVNTIGKSANVSETGLAPVTTY